MRNRGKKKNLLFGFILDIIILILGRSMNLFIVLCTRFSVSYWIVFEQFSLGATFKFGTIFAKKLNKSFRHFIENDLFFIFFLYFLFFNQSDFWVSRNFIREKRFNYSPENSIICYISCINIAKECMYALLF